MQSFFLLKKCFRINIFLAYSKQVGITDVLDMDAFTIKSVEIIKKCIIICCISTEEH